MSARSLAPGLASKGNKQYLHRPLDVWCIRFTKTTHLIIPALLYRLSYPLGVFFPVVLVQIARLHIRRRAGIRVVQ